MMFIKAFRVCSECRKVMYEGYFKDEVVCYCSDECLEKNMTRAQYEKLHNSGNGAFWEDWSEELCYVDADKGAKFDEWLSNYKKYEVVFEGRALVEIKAKNYEEAKQIADILLWNRYVDWTKVGILSIKKNKKTFEGIPQNDISKNGPFLKTDYIDEFESELQINSFADFFMGFLTTKRNFYIGQKS